MKRLLALMLMMAATLAGAQSNPTSSTPGLSPAERNMAESQGLIRDKPAQSAGYKIGQLAIIFHYQ